VAIAVWPLADRQRVVRAYKPGEATESEAPFRTLRAHRWASAGRRISPRAAGRLTGQITMFSALNVESARLARHGYTVAAAQLALAAEDLEAGAEFAVLQRALSGLPAERARLVIDGVLPDDAPDDVVAALGSLTRRTEQLRVGEPLLDNLAEINLGRVTAVFDTHVVIGLLQGLETLVPRWMAVAVHRDVVGQVLAVVLDRVHPAAAVTEAVAAIEYGADGIDADRFHAFGRHDRAALRLTPADERLLEGSPMPLKVIVPVPIDE
jgi:hypothetical protein